MLSSIWRLYFPNIDYSAVYLRHVRFVLHIALLACRQYNSLFYMKLYLREHHRNDTVVLSSGVPARRCRNGASRCEVPAWVDGPVFVPYGVGLMVSYEAIMKNFWAIIVASVVSTVLIMLVVGWVYQKMVHRR